MLVKKSLKKLFNRNWKKRNLSRILTQSLGTSRGKLRDVKRLLKSKLTRIN
jgi:hypothetical protein